MNNPHANNEGVPAWTLNSKNATNSSSYTPSHVNDDLYFVRGVNLGGWLVLERYITPYLFAVTDCHLRGDLCWYPGQISAPKVATTSDDDNMSSTEPYELCNLYQCQPHRVENIFNKGIDYPIDEYTLGLAFENDMEAGERWLNTHFDVFVTKELLVELKTAGVNHVRVPLPHWILGTDTKSMPWIVGKRWEYFLRLLKWARELDLQVWPDLHTSPGSQNGFDNSGQSFTEITCQRFTSNAEHAQTTLAVLDEITLAVKQAGYADIVTGFGLLNEPFMDCDRAVYDQFLLDGKHIVRKHLGQDAVVYVSDMFRASTFNNGQWWTDAAVAADEEPQFANTFLDSHYYQVFNAEPRALSPRQHIAFVCQNEYRDVASCCYRDASGKSLPASNPKKNLTGVQRMVGEWSVAYDALPAALLEQIMTDIAKTGMAPHLDRELSAGEQAFLRQFAKAQMVAYEVPTVPGLAGAWFFWNFQMEGGTYAEWDFLRGIREGWIPTPLAKPHEYSADLFQQSCYDILFETDDKIKGVIDQVPKPNQATDYGQLIDDDVVVTHGQSILHPNAARGGIFPLTRDRHSLLTNALWIGAIALLLAAVIVRLIQRAHRRNGYSPILMAAPTAAPHHETKPLKHKSSSSTTVGESVGSSTGMDV